MDADEEAIVIGWAKVARTYEPRPLNWHEQQQVERAELAERLAEKTPFTLGEPIY